MKILILSCNTGEGHNSAANAVAELMRPKGHECHIRDALAYLSRGVSSFICNWHVRIYRNIPFAFNIGYRLCEKGQNGKDRSVIMSFLKGGTDKLYAEIKEGDYDFVLSTHPFSAYMYTNVKKKHGVNIRSGFIATDYVCCPPVDKTDIDCYFIPHESLKADFTARFVPEERLYGTGLPVRPEFYKKYPKAVVKRALDLPDGKDNVLLMCGSMGCGPLKELAVSLSKALPDSAHLTVICGSNKRLKKSLDDHGFERGNVRVLGYTKNVHHYMDSAEFIITKAGGITCTESMVKGLPMVLVNAIGGCESYNRDFFTAKGGAVIAEGDVAELAVKLLSSKKKLKAMSAAMNALYMGNAAENICDIICGKER